MVIPKHDFIVWPLWTFASSNEGQNIASVEHLYNSNAPVDVSDKLASKGDGVEYAETCLGTHCKAILVLIEANVANVLLRLISASCHGRWS